MKKLENTNLLKENITKKIKFHFMYQISFTFDDDQVASDYLHTLVIEGYWMSSKDPNTL